MSRRLFSYMVVALVSMALTTIFQPLRYMETLAQGQAGCQTFKETGKTVCGRFLQYWQQNGGLAQQGFPLTNEFKEVSDLNGQEYTVQYFERAVFESHPENKAPFDVLLSQLGRFQFERKYNGVDPAPSPTATLPALPTPIPTATAITSQEPPRISLQDFKALYDVPAKRPLILDARSSFAYEEGHIKGAISFPLSDVDSRVKELPKDKFIVAYCQ